MSKREGLLRLGPSVIANPREISDMLTCRQIAASLNCQREGRIPLGINQKKEVRK